MTTNFVHDGKAIDYTPGGDRAEGEVVVYGTRIGVTRSPIKANELGALHLTGVYDFPKATGSGEALAEAALAYWDAGSGEISDSATGNVLAGIFVQAAGDDDETARVRLTP